MPEENANSEFADKILRADLRNIIAKVKDGKTLTETERKRVEGLSANEDKNDVKSIKELAELLGVSRQTIYTWKKNEDAPKTNSLSAWQDYLQQQGAVGARGTGKLNVGGKNFTATDIADLKGQLLAEKTGKETAERKLKEIELAKVQEGWIPKNEAMEAIKRVLEPLARILQGFPRRYAQRIDSNDPEGCEEILTECINEVVRQLHASRGESLNKRKGTK